MPCLKSGIGRNDSGTEELQQATTSYRSRFVVGQWKRNVNKAEVGCLLFRVTMSLCGYLYLHRNMSTRIILRQVGHSHE